MPANLFKLPVRSVLAGLTAVLMVTACAPDMFQLGRSTQLDNFLSKVASNCGSMYINQYQVWLLANDENDTSAGQEDFFMDQASMLLYGTITPDQYIADMGGFFDDESPRGMKTYQCIIAQLPQNAPALPKAYREVMKAAPQVSGND